MPKVLGIIRSEAVAEMLAQREESNMSTEPTTQERIRQAWDEGYTTGYEAGTDDEIGNDRGCPKHPDTKQREKEQAWQDSETKAAL